MSRLLHAAARGARIQLYVEKGNLPEQRWRTVHTVPTFPCADFRIHPEDAYLQYGPISSALREVADADLRYPDVRVPPYGSWYTNYSDALNFGHADELHKALYLLILAEALADEGL